MAVEVAELQSSCPEQPLHASYAKIGLFCVIFPENMCILRIPILAEVWFFSDRSGWLPINSQRISPVLQDVSKLGNRGLSEQSMSRHVRARDSHSLLVRRQQVGM